MKKLLSGCLLPFVVLLLSACQPDVATDPVDTPEVPEQATEVFEYDGIINKNIQNLLCNSVHHAQAGRQDQAYHKLDVAKNEKLVALLSKEQITQDQYLSLDQWIGELIEMLYNDFSNYPQVYFTFPFTCSGLNEQTEAVGEVVELEEEYDVGNANAFLEQVCYSIFASDEQKYADSGAYLLNASVIAGQMLLDQQLEQEHKDQLVEWITDLSVVLVTQPQNYNILYQPFECAQYESSYAPLNIGEPVKDVLHDFLDAADGVIDNVVNVVKSWF